MELPLLTCLLSPPAGNKLCSSFHANSLQETKSMLITQMIPDCVCGHGLKLPEDGAGRRCRSVNPWCDHAWLWWAPTPSPRCVHGVRQGRPVSCVHCSPTWAPPGGSRRVEDLCFRGTELMMDVLWAAGDPGF
ncbi:hypothetical protein C0Q70_15556 [Pomacea canaliculata]|uniref:Uncharacterized protein n=1 Tax=Pomacea canaliculata TaxID=400727 RepID=A0A2T7NV51_POMCA|nr:hypothetical protein C0Q70_15556 [Pomacea canaliculata]